MNTVAGGLIADSGNVFDKLSTEVVCTRGTERRVDIELMGLKQAQLRNGVVVRWAHSDAQLSSSLTKNEQRQLQLWYKMQQRWRIVQDDAMASAKRRRELRKNLWRTMYKHHSHSNQHPTLIHYDNKLEVS